ncbi:hypothetical protein T11_11898 [Trichinella zimbabwensis]|uniref:Uncharacterized protein n=1 Tax=Trichinella zimbabwensis TaxID=268475 RepID=A0A0V1F3D6_9BILA|nr:hypothetical protein T11_11898 [Trichinella zimbabwensis]
MSKTFLMNIKTTPPLTLIYYRRFFYIWSNPNSVTHNHICF